MKAKTLYICTFTLAQTDNIDSFPALDRQFYEAAVMGTSELIFQDGFKDMDGNVLTSACSFQNPNFQDFLKVANAPAPPFVAIIGEFPDGQKRLYITKSPQQVKNLIKQMWLGEFGGTTPMPTNLGDGEGGWGEGSSVVCKIFPPLCALGFLPWLVLAGIATYKTAESRSTLGKATWGVPAALLWLGFFERGGVKQIQWWLKKAGIGKIYKPGESGGRGYWCNDEKVLTYPYKPGACSWHGGIDYTRSNATAAQRVYTKRKQRLSKK